MDKAHLPFNKIDTIIVTHQDIDHIGGINNIVNKLNDVKVLAHIDEKPYIQGEKKLIRLEKSNIMERIKALPDNEQLKILDMFENTSVKVDMALTDGEKLSYGDGIIVIHTPGHTPGHICLYHEKSKSLIVGDALNIEGGELVVTHKEAMDDKELEIIKGWLGRFGEFDVENVISYHGGLFNDNPNQRIKELIRSF
jgi:glyoxylase-like metal-dependent hydrolase (beta-lactamase superfamily II)